MSIFEVLLLAFFQRRFCAFVVVDVCFCGLPVVCVWHTTEREESSGDRARGELCFFAL